MKIVIGTVLAVLLGIGFWSWVAIRTVWGLMRR